jgi:integrase
MEPQAIYRQPIDQVSRDQIKANLRELAKRRSPATVESVHAVLSSVFEEGIDSGLIGSNPARGLLKKILPPKNQRDLKDPAPMTVEERDRMIATAERVCCRSMQLILKVMSLMGFRLGEVLAMRAKHIDLSRRLFHVIEAYKSETFRKPKGGKSRFVDIPESLAAELEAHVVALKKEGLQAGRGGQVDLLFVKPGASSEGRWPFSQRDVQCELKRVCMAAGLEIRNPHDLRHTYATILLMAG